MNSTPIDSQTYIYAVRGIPVVRALRTNSRTLSFNYMRLDSLTRLQSFSVDMDNEGLSTQHLLMKKFLKYLYRPTTGSLHFALTALKLTSLARIDVPLLRLISKNTPALVHLHVSCTERLWYECCWNCYTDNAECFIHSPIPDMFIDADDLARQFSLALKPLTKLTHLHMGIFLTQESYLYEHVAHARYEQSYPPDECDVCTKTTLQTPFIDSDLSDDHPQNNALDILDPAAEMEAIELRASLIFAKNIRSLTRISWSSWLGQRSSVDWKGEEEPTVDTRGAPNTTIWIRRHAGRVRLRSAPW
ncbi:hypothetical protein PC9H_006414 [Pleurotus ostreatus]|uniref:Uncharacterized protein n=1 Tax=Pleurotus ostreatus TaxID=5322 RepID=A0A8H6ZW65_PLEOS|nr:uncharacterized protein PC9H_006414 [Pleurotus ostreatus]KAF7430703.1 hypothetical protein PC9H_006414 [Pleurotus ostreatus]